MAKLAAIFHVRSTCLASDFKTPAQGAFGFHPPILGMPERQEKIILLELRCTVCALSIDVEFSSTPVSPLVPPRHLVTCAIPSFHRIWPVAALGFAVIVNMSWIGFLGFEFFKLMKLAFS